MLLKEIIEFIQRMKMILNKKLFKKKIFWNIFLSIISIIKNIIYLIKAIILYIIQNIKIIIIKKIIL